MEPCFLTAAEAAGQIRAGTLTSEALVRSCLDRVAIRDPDVKAWSSIDRDRAISLARDIDKRPPTGPLHGLPFGVKDVIDTVDMPTTYNSPIYQGHRPAKDAACVAVARASGALILGKTDTVEFASGGRRAATRNPQNFQHTPGGSSSGSGAAVGDFQVPLAFGTQTGGSHIRPASFNGIYGLKPTWGVVSREGAKQYSTMLDTIGWYGRSVADLSLVAEAFQLFGLGQEKPFDIRGLRVAYCETPYWSTAEPEGKSTLELAADRLEKAGAVIVALDLPAPFGGLFEAQTVIMHGEGRASFLPEYLGSKHILHADFVEKVENKMAITGKRMAEAYDLAAACRRDFDAMFEDFDVVLAPASTGEAPEGLHNTGNPIFNAMWTLLHVPCLGIPCTTGPKNLPVGIQIIGPRFADARLLAIGDCVAPWIDCEEKPRR